MALESTVLSFILAISRIAGAPASPSPQPVPTFPPHGGAFVTSLPAAASAWLDGTYIGQTPVYVDDLLPGRHSVTISRSGWQPETAGFDVFVGRIIPVSLVMRRVVRSPGGPSAQPKGQGTLAVRGGPSGGRVYIDGAAVGALPVEAHTVQAGFHIVTLELPGKNATKSMRVVDVFPDTATVVEFAAAPGGAPQAAPGDDVLEPLDSAIPANSVVVSGNDVTIHYRGIEVECAIGSRTYTVNGKAGTLSVAPAIVGGKIYLPQTLLARLQGK